MPLHGSPTAPLRFSSTQGGPSSRLSGFYRLDPAERLAEVARRFGLSDEGVRALQAELGLTLETAEQMIENVIGIQALPVGLAVNCRISGVDRVVPMTVEEPSIVAAVSNMARLTRRSGGVETSSDPSVMIAQIQVDDVDDPQSAIERVLAAKASLLGDARRRAHRMVARGGGPLDIEARVVDIPKEDGGGTFVVVHILVDCLDCMGANLVNDLAEHLAPSVEALTGGRVGLRILSNLSDRRTATARVRIPIEHLGSDNPEAVAQGIVDAYRFAAADPYRAATHNKGIMNGVDAVAVATGNDWRAIEAGAHAYACQNGRYRPMSRWTLDDGHLVGEMTLPMAVGIVGGTIKVHPTVRANLKLLGITEARELAEVMVAIGLLQNLAALNALATEGIQRGHMSLHTRHIVQSVGVPAERVNEVVQAMIDEKVYSAEGATRIWMSLSEV